MPSGFAIQDLKFYASGNYTRLNDADPKNVFQLRTYMLLSDYGVDEGLLIYFNVDTMEYTIFSVPFDEEAFRDELETKLDWLKAMLGSKSPNVVPRACRKETHVRAQECPVRQACFKLRAAQDDPDVADGDPGS